MLADFLSIVQVPSGYFLTDMWLYVDMLFDGKLLRDDSGKVSKVDLAADEALKLKKLVGAIRALWRSSSTGHCEKVTELKSRPSPRKQREEET